MPIYNKGIHSKDEIIRLSKEIFNEEGLHLTLANLAARLHITLGKITYHFPTKDHLFLAIAEEYEFRFEETRINNQTEKSGLEGLYLRSLMIMELQYEYRCAIRYIASTARKQTDIHKHLTQKYSQNRQRIYSLIEGIVSLGELDPSILYSANYDVFVFTFTNLHTTWMINLEIYDTDKTFETLKPVYLKGIFSCFKPYLTDKGRFVFTGLDLL
jgi:AcrR family transcriptional regulator